MRYAKEVRRFVGRRLPAPVKSALRRTLPASWLWPEPALRRFWLKVPGSPSTVGPTASSVGATTRVRIEAPGRSYVPRLHVSLRGVVSGLDPEGLTALA
ncbi:MAG: hypothetical protein ABI598_04830 [Chloroflexota bacterium]